MTQNQRSPRKSQVDTDHPRLQEEMGRQHLNEELEKHRQSLTEQLQNLEQLAQSSPHSILKLGDASFWEFKPRLDKVMKDVHGVVTKSLQKGSK